jgi:hypothetical protein
MITNMRDQDRLQPDDSPFSDMGAGGTDESGSWISYSQSYKMAADDLIEAAFLRKEAAPEVTRLYPILFLYRHFLELELKSITVLGYIAKEIPELEKKLQRLLSTHSLTALIAECRPLLVSESSTPSFRTQFDRLEHCVREFAAHDPNSYAFRYPVDKSLNLYKIVPGAVDLVNLRAVIDRMAKVLREVRKALQNRLEELENVDTWTDEDTLIYAKDVLGIAEDEGTIEEAQDEWDFWR